MSWLVGDLGNTTSEIQEFNANMHILPINHQYFRTQYVHCLFFLF